MKIGYPAKNLTLGEYGEGTFKVISFDPGRCRAVVAANLEKLAAVLAWNVEHGLLFYRLPFELVPNAASPRSKLRWEDEFGPQLRRLGERMRREGHRIAIHAELYTAINQPGGRILESSVRELEYCARLLDALELDATAKVQVHVGDVLEDKAAGLRHFAEQFRRLDGAVQRRLVVENDCIGYTLSDCVHLHDEVGLPVVFDVLHHQVQPSGEALPDALRRAAATWRPTDGLMLVDYSSQRPGRMPGKHAESIDLDDFRGFLDASAGQDLDLMIEIKDMERSALRALDALRGDPRLVDRPAEGSAS
jgi:UV DNA damage endonuclease